MIPLIGYADMLSLRPGETINFKVSNTASEPYKARLVRIICGDPNPEGPGIKEEDIPAEFAGQYPSRPQSAVQGSYATIDIGDRRLDSFTLVATIWPTLPGKPDPWSPYDKKFDGFWKGGRHWSEIVADDAIDYLGMAKKDKRPFFMYVAFNAPHDPRQAPKEYIDKYPLSRIRVPENFLAQYPYKDQIGNPHKLRDERLGPMPRTEHSVKVHRQEYYAIITHLDTQVGRILDTLEKSGQADNTYIFFSADHGLAVGHHGLFGKQNLYEHSTRVPFMVVGPGIKAGAKVDAPIYLQDVHPTTIELAGGKPAEKVEFHSLLPILNGKSKKHAYSDIYGAYLGLQRSVTVDGWKLILYPQVNKARLYNIEEDPFEKKDLAHDPGQAKRISTLFARMLKLQKEMDDKVDLKQSFPKL